jgi:cytochrome P450
MQCPHAHTLTDPATNENPYEFYGWMLKEAPVYFDPGINAYIVASYDLIRKVALNPAVFSNEQAQLNQWNHRPGGMPQRATEILHEGIPHVPTLVTSDPPVHKRTRALVQLAFSQPRVAAMRGYIEGIANLLIDGFVDDGKVELVSRFSMMLPIYVISDQLGVPRRDFALIKAWSDAFVGLRGLMGSDDEIVGFAERLVEFQTYFGELIAARRARGPAENDMLDVLINARTEGEHPLDHAELISTIQQLMVAGNESTTSAITSGVVIMLENPAKMSQIVEEKRMLRFVEEVLRLESPGQGVLRRAVVDTQIGGVAIPKGALVQLRHGAGNRDGAVFASPNVFDCDRTESRPNLAFGFGPHLCIGNALAREEMCIAFATLRKRLPNLRFEPGANDFSHHRSTYVRALRALHLRFDPERAPTT